MKRMIVSASRAKGYDAPSLKHAIEYFVDWAQQQPEYVEKFDDLNVGIDEIEVSKRDRPIKFVPHVILTIGQTAKFKSKNDRLDRWLWLPACPTNQAVSEDFYCTEENLSEFINVVSSGVASGDYDVQESINNFKDAINALNSKYGLDVVPDIYDEAAVLSGKDDLSDLSATYSKYGNAFLKLGKKGTLYVGALNGWIEIKGWSHYSSHDNYFPLDSQTLSYEDAIRLLEPRYQDIVEWEDALAAAQQLFPAVSKYAAKTQDEVISKYGNVASTAEWQDPAIGNIRGEEVGSRNYDMPIIYWRPIKDGKEFVIRDIGDLDAARTYLMRKFQKAQRAPKRGPKESPYTTNGGVL